MIGWWSVDWLSVDGLMITYLIDKGLRPFQQLFSHIMCIRGFHGFLTPVLHTTYFFSTYTVSPIRWRRMTHVTVTFVKTSERMLAELGFEFITLGLTARVAIDWVPGLGTTDSDWASWLSESTVHWLQVRKFLRYSVTI